MSECCPHCFSKNSQAEGRKVIVSNGSFFRKSDLSLQQRFLCRNCKKTFSAACFHPCYRQKKRHLNPRIFELLSSGISQRRLALVLEINRKTVVRKFHFLGIASFLAMRMFRENLPPATGVEFDELETFEHTKMKPLSVIMMVESKSRRILGFRVARMAAKGLLVKRALKKYGPRIDERRKVRNELFKELQPYVLKNAAVKSDQNPHYPEAVKRHFPLCGHTTTKGRRGCVTGQGELKAGGFDPLFTLNHTFAMFRANINRLFRKTWATTKKPECLALHIAIYVFYHNQFLIQK
jgi:transposase-like protein